MLGEGAQLMAAQRLTRVKVPPAGRILAEWNGLDGVDCQWGKGAVKETIASSAVSTNGIRPR